MPKSEDTSGIDSEDQFEFTGQLKECLDNVQHAGTFATSKSTDFYVNPGLVIGKVGPVGLPLSPRDAQAIAAVCKQSPFGRKDETVVDESVRKTWELDGTDFDCSNPAWSNYLDILAQQAMKNLGVQVPAKAEQYKLLLYEEGAFFKAHRDTEKVPGMFGTLVVCLPSVHTGGEVLLVHGAKQRKLETAKTSAFHISALAWYSDVQHEISPVTSGYRLVLTYNLVQDQQLPKQSAAELDVNASKLENQLQIWRMSISHLNFVLYPLEHQYTQVSLSLENLKGQDAARCRILERICSRNGFWWFFTLMMRQTVDDDYYGDLYADDEDEYSNRITIKTSLTSTGKATGLNLEEPQREQVLADEKSFFDRDPDSEDEGDYTGNESMPNKQRYHDTVISIIRKDYLINRISQHPLHPPQMKTLLEYVREDQYLDLNQRRNAYGKMLQSTINALTGRSFHTGYFHGSLYMGKDTMLVQYSELFQSTANQLDLMGQSKIVAELVRTAIHGKNWFGTDHLVDLVSKQVTRELAAGKEGVWSTWLGTPMPPSPTYKFVMDRGDFFKTVERSLASELISSFNLWKQEEIPRLIKSIIHFTREDVEPLVNLAFILTSKLFLDMVLPILVKSRDPIGLSTLLYSLSVRENLPTDFRANTLQPTFEAILPILLPNRRISAGDLFTKIEPIQHKSFSHNQYSWPQPRKPEPPRLSSVAVELVGIVQQCLRMNLDNEAEELLASALPDIVNTRQKLWSEWNPVFMFIPHLLTITANFPHAELNNLIFQFVKNSVQIAAEMLLRYKPSQPRDWHIPDIRLRPCSCEACTDVDKFLKDSAQGTGRFAYNQGTRAHIQSQFVCPKDFTFTIEKRGTPYTLVVEKYGASYTTGLSEWMTDVKDLQHRVRTMRTELVTSALGEDALQTPELDDALKVASATQMARGPASVSAAPMFTPQPPAMFAPQFPPVFHHHGIRPPASSTAPLGPSSASTQNTAPVRPWVGGQPPSGTKRPIEMIDLTEDEVSTSKRRIWE